MIVDLTQTIEENIQVFEKSIKPLKIPWSNLKQHGYNLELIFMSSHTGTHIDAPNHFGYNTSIDEIDLNKVVSDAILLRIKKDANEFITKDDLAKYNIDSKAVIISTSWEKIRYNDNYLTANPGLSIDAAEYLINANIDIIGIDTPNIDHNSSKGFVVHHKLLSNNILIIENLCNLDKLPSRFKIIALPLKIKGATGSPARVIAVID